MTRSWRCADCDGYGMYPTRDGMCVCDCEAGRSRQEYLGMTEPQRLKAFRERRRKRKKSAEPSNAQEEIPF